MSQDGPKTTHRIDVWFFCERCGLSLREIFEERLSCEIPSPRELARRKFAAAEARAPLEASLGRTVRRLVECGRLPESCLLKEPVPDADFGVSGIGALAHRRPALGRLH
jgi:hypothetical protein